MPGASRPGSRRSWLPSSSPGDGRVADNTSQPALRGAQQALDVVLAGPALAQEQLALKMRAQFPIVRGEKRSRGIVAVRNADLVSNRLRDGVQRRIVAAA